MSHGKPPPPPCRGTTAAPRACAMLASCLRRACYGGKTTRAAPPPHTHTSAPPRVGDAGRGGGLTAPPPEDIAAGWGGSGDRVRDGPHDRARREHAPCKPQRGDHRGCERRVGRATTGATRHAPPPPAEGQVPRLVPAPCLRRACDMRATKGRRQAPPPHTPPPPQGWGMKVGRGGQRPPPPPEDKAARWGGSGERVRDGPHDRARRKHAPCKPQRGGHRGCERRVGRATTGATRQAPPPLQRDKCRASCLRRACDVLTPEDGQRGRPPPLLPHTPRKGARTARRRQGDMGGGGAEDRPTRQEERRAAGGGDEKKKEQSKPTCQGKKARRQGPKPRRTGGGRGDMGPQETLVRYPTSGVRGPQRRNPPPPHCSQVPHSVLASCLRRACDVRATKGRRQGRPPPPPHTPPPPRGWGMTVAERGPPPRTKRQGGEAAERGCGTDHTTVPKGSTGGPLGRRPQGRKGDDGSHTASPPPTCRGTIAAPRACTVLATCLRQRTGSEDAPPPTPFSSTHPRKGRGQRGDSEGTWGGGRGQTETPGGERSGERWTC